MGWLLQASPGGTIDSPDGELAVNRVTLQVTGIDFRDPARPVIGLRAIAKNETAQQSLAANVALHWESILVSDSGYVGYYVETIDAWGQPLTGDLTPGYLPLDLVLPAIPVDLSPTPTGGMLMMDPRLQEDLVRLTEAVQGDPRAANGYFVRCLYLSVVTVTTLGIGDMVPITKA